VDENLEDIVSVDIQVVRGAPAATVAKDRVPAEAKTQEAFGQEYAELRKKIMAARLLDRTGGYYLARTCQSFALLVLAVALPFLLPQSLGWLVLTSVLLGFAVIQIGLIGHDAGHLQVFRRPQWNWALGMLAWSLTIGLGFWYWNDRHTRHHARTNDVDMDPDLAGTGLLAFTAEDAASRRGWERWMVHGQAARIPWYLLLTLLVAFGFRYEGWAYSLRELRGKRRILEVALLTANVLLWSAPVLVLGWSWVLFFLCAQAVAGTYLFFVIAPNHVGMPVWAQGRTLAYLQRQLISTRNLHADPVTDFVFGGLNYQIEHHLFPTMPRVNLSRARAIIKPYCREHGLPFEEVSAWEAYRAFIAEMRRVGRAAA
jgi:fatty acid desaturase